MAYMTWMKEWDTGIEVIDKQHRRIVELINQLHDARRGNGALAAANRALFDLIDYTINHFSFEEELQAQAGYPFSKAHKRVHEVFIKKVHAYRERAGAGEDVGLELAQMLEKWLVSHIKVDDADYAPLVKEKLQLQEAVTTGWLAGGLQKFFGGREA